MKIAILLTEIYTMPDTLKELIFAPHELAFDLADELVSRGHEVTLFTHSKQKTKAKLVNSDLKPLTKHILKAKQKPLEFAEQNRDLWNQLAREIENNMNAQAMKMAKNNEFDILHHFMAKTDALYYSSLIKTPTLCTLHDPLDHSPALEYKLKQNSKQNFVSISKNQRTHNPKLKNIHFAANVYNGINLKKFPFNAKGSKHLIHFGRLLEKKGVHLAIDAAIKTKHKIKLAGTIEGKDNPRSYYQTKLKPRFAKPEVTYSGFLKGWRSRAKFLGHAKAFLFPCSWEEPFGLAVIESLACGTPVIAFKRGAIPEIMIDGKTGFLVNNLREMQAAIKKIDRIDREFCRKHVEKHFSLQRMADDYERVYRRLAK